MMEDFGIKFTALAKTLPWTANSQRCYECWMNSPGHRNNILSPSFTEIGVGLAKGPTEGFTGLKCL